MLLQYLVENILTKNGLEKVSNIEVEKIEYSSENITKGDVFVAIEGYKTDGHEYIKQAINNGAVAIIINKGKKSQVNKLLKQENLECEIVEVENTRIALAKMAAKYYDYPSTKLKMIGITGTKGKTTTAYMIRDIMLAANKRIGMIGTICNTYGDVVEDATRTSPESLDLHALLKRMVDAKMEYVVMEVSSHALALDRVHSIQFDVGVFTNLSQEHLDFHENMEQYLLAKAKLFKQSTFAIINADDLYVNKLSKLIECKTAKYGLDNSSSITATDIRINNAYTSFKMYIDKHLQTIVVPIPGKYTVYNALAAISVASLLGAQMEDVLKGLAGVNVPGRSEIVPIEKAFAVLIDYAHTPASLEAILVNTKKYIKGRIICVFGCGGNRDTAKRYEMGKISGRLANFTIITTDNPRDEQPEDIAKEIEKGIKETKGMYKVILDRKQAIAFAMRIAWQQDTIIIAGKGHETYQELKKGKKIHFDDREVVKEIASTIQNKNQVKY